MPLFWLSAMLVIGMNLAYHICQKSIPLKAHVLVSVIVTFIVAMAASLPLLLLFPPEAGIISAAKKVGWASVLRGLAIVGIEAGYLLLYRSGWKISLGPVFCYTCVVALLIPVGSIFFNEKLTWTQGLGLLLAMIGVFLMTQS